MCGDNQYWDGDENNGTCKTFLSYNQGLCDNDFQVRSFIIIIQKLIFNFKLKCVGNLLCRKSGTTCNCPVNVVDYPKCDCPTRTVNNEYYWDGNEDIMISNS